MGKVKQYEPAKRSLRLRKAFIVPADYDRPLDSFRGHMTKLGYLGHGMFLFTIADFSPDSPDGGLGFIRGNGTYRSGATYCASGLDPNKFIFAFTDADIFNMTEWKDGTPNSLGELCEAYGDHPGVLICKRELFVPHCTYEHEFRKPDEKLKAVHGLVPIVLQEDW